MLVVAQTLELKVSYLKVRMQIRVGRVLEDEADRCFSGYQKKIILIWMLQYRRTEKLGNIYDLFTAFYIEKRRFDVIFTDQVFSGLSDV